MSPVDSLCLRYLRWTLVENQYTSGTIRISGPKRTAANFQDIKTKITNAVMKVTTILIIEVEESATTSSN